MTKVLSLRNHKSKKKSGKILSDLEEINKIMAMSIRAMSFYKQYIPVKHSMLGIQEHKLTIEHYIKKLKDELEKDKE